jgi:hypothetical protein
MCGQIWNDKLSARDPKELKMSAHGRIPWSAIGVKNNADPTR